jgi:hypothetical protein
MSWPVVTRMLVVGCRDPAEDAHNTRRGNQLRMAAL